MTAKAPFQAPAPVTGEFGHHYLMRVASAFVDWVNAPSCAPAAPVDTPALVLRMCDCDCGSPCPNGKAGSAARCVMMVKP